MIDLRVFVLCKCKRANKVIALTAASYIVGRCLSVVYVISKQVGSLLHNQFRDLNVIIGSGQLAQLASP